jgi:probable rRNA maturation factor
MTVEVRNRQPRSRSRLQVDTRALKTLAAQALELVGAAAHYNLSIALVTDKQIAALNARYHQVHGPTDILSFDYGEGQGELIMSTERVRAQARQFRTTPGRELALCVIHGILHLHGHDDVTSTARRKMRAAERRLMRQIARRTGTQSLAVQ